MPIFDAMEGSLQSHVEDVKIWMRWIVRILFTVGATFVAVSLPFFGEATNPANRCWPKTSLRCSRGPLLIGNGQGPSNVNHTRLFICSSDPCAYAFVSDDWDFSYHAAPTAVQSVDQLRPNQGAPLALTLSCQTHQRDGKPRLTCSDHTARLLP